LEMQANQPTTNLAQPSGGGMEMEPRATRPQAVAVSILSLLVLAVGVVVALLGASPGDRARIIDVTLIAWFALTAPSAAYVAWDAFTRTPQPVVMKWGWLLMTLYVGPIGAALYILSCEEPAPGDHEAFIRPLWKQGLGSTIHCVAGDATGIIAAAVVTTRLGLPMWFDVIVEYVAGFAFGLLIFQALFMKGMFGGSYAEALRRSFFPEWLSMNGVMAGMVAIMVPLMALDPSPKEATSIHFWGVMALAVLAGLIVAYPFNVWLVHAGFKHGMSTDRPGVPIGGGTESQGERGGEAVDAGK